MKSTWPSAICFSLTVLFVVNFFYAHSQNQKKVDSLEKILLTQKEDTNKVSTLVALAKNYERLDPSKTLIYAREITALSKKIDYPRGIGLGYMYTGIYYSITGNHEVSIDSLKMAEAIFSELNLRKDLSNVYSSFCLVYGQTAQYEEAIKYGLKDLQLNESAGDSIAMIGDYLNIGSVYSSMHNPEEARQNFRKVIDLSEKLNYKKGISMGYNNLGMTYTAEKNYSTAIQYYLKALELKKELNDQVGIGKSLNNIGSNYIKLGDKQNALSYLHQARLLAIRMGTTQELLRVYGNLGIAFTDFNNYDSAAHYLNATLHLSRQTKDRDNASNAIAALSDLYEAKGDYKTALEYHKHYKEAEDSILSAEQDQAIAELKTKYETGKKDQQIALLNTQEQLKDEQIARQRLALGGSIAAAILLLITGGGIVTAIQRKRKVDTQLAMLEKQNEIASIRNKISLDIHDDIGAGLTKINLLLNQFKSKASANGANNELQDLATKISGKSREVISALGEIVWTVNPEQDSLLSMLGFMRQYIARFFEDAGIRYHIDFPEAAADAKIHPELKRNLFLVLKESLNNVMKHSGATEVNIRFHRKGDHFTMEIADNGTGVDEKPLSSLGNGLKSMKRRIEEVKGTFDLNSIPGNGTNISLEGMLY